MLCILVFLSSEFLIWANTSQPFCTYFISVHYFSALSIRTLQLRRTTYTRVLLYDIPSALWHSDRVRRTISVGVLLPARHCSSSAFPSLFLHDRQGNIHWWSIDRPSFPSPFLTLGGNLVYVFPFIMIQLSLFERPSHALDNHIRFALITPTSDIVWLMNIWRSTKLHTSHFSHCSSDVDATIDNEVVDSGIYVTRAGDLSLSSIRCFDTHLCRLPHSTRTRSTLTHPFNYSLIVVMLFDLSQWQIDTDHSFHSSHLSPSFPITAISRMQHVSRIQLIIFHNYSITIPERPPLS